MGFSKILELSTFPSMVDVLCTEHVYLKHYYNENHLDGFPSHTYAPDSKSLDSHYSQTCSCFLFLLNNKQVAVGELELNPEFSLMQWSVEDFENKIQV